MTPWLQQLNYLLTASDCVELTADSIHQINSNILYTKIVCLQGDLKFNNWLSSLFTLFWNVNIINNSSYSLIKSSDKMIHKFQAVPCSLNKKTCNFFQELMKRPKIYSLRFQRPSKQKIKRILKVLSNDFLGGSRGPARSCISYRLSNFSALAPVRHRV